MDIDIAEALARSDLAFIDVRSPGEFTEASIPGAANVPLFDNLEYKLLGTIYQQAGENKARREALGIVAPKLPALVAQIIKISGNNIPLLYCSRGGMRSYSLYQVLSLTGIQVLRLKKGYKAYRRYVTERLTGYRLESKLFILHGLTGVGKTAVLAILKDQGLPVIDLEGLARHRGSVFGAVGFDTPRSQKDFDALLLQQLDRFRNEPALLIEGEGRRIGNIYLPFFLAEAMENGYQVLLKTSLETRVKRIVDTYIPADIADKTHKQLREALGSLSRRLGAGKVNWLLEKLDQKEYYLVAKTLCTDYYDRYYSDSRPELTRFESEIDATDLHSAAIEITAMIKSADLLCKK